MTPLHFFPRDRQFWLYHCTAVAAGLGVTVGITMIWGYMIGYQVTTSVAWVPLYSLAVLGFRWFYKRHAGHTVPMGWLIAWAVLYSAIAGALMAALLQLMVLPFFWHIFVAK
jgi:hypothetical protein